MATPVSKADMDPNFEKRLRDMKEAAKKEYNQRKKGQQVKWLRPENWAGDVTDPETFKEPFERTKANDDFEAAIKDAKSPGTVGDLIATTTMIDYLSVMERAFRSRHLLQRPRAMAHALGRKKGHGAQTGPFIQGIEYLRTILKQAKS